MSYYDRKMAKSSIYRFCKILPKSSWVITKIYGYFIPTNIYKKNFTKETECIVDGPPRCANHFILEHVFQNVDGINISHHYHSVGLIKIGSRYKIPTIALIRDPYEQMKSSIIYSKEIRAEILLYELYTYYKNLSKITNIVISDFTRSTQHPKSVMNELFFKYPEQFPAAKAKDFSDDYIFNCINERKKELSAIKSKNPRPTAEKEKLKMQIEDNVRSIMDSCLGKKTTNIYKDLKAISDIGLTKFL